ncbi:MAG: HAMP domain-containing histidine kinase [Oscillospiraceae bacterium]|nr:HAMP domain-containing histidine kinase [Oscillospiraceae bacterium]
MKSFRKILVRNFVGTTFAILLIVYILFNALTNNFISTEAQRELNRSISDVEYIIGAEAPVFIVSSDFPLTVRMVDDFWVQWNQIRTIQHLMMNTDGIIINENNELLAPDLSRLSESVFTEIVLLSNYYVENRASFEYGAMVRVSEGENTYYMRTTRLPVTSDISLSFVMYTDITSAITFMGNINLTLGVLLVISGIITILLSILMSSNLQKAVMRLCKYAEVIGHGKFDGEAGAFEYKEFNDLAQSMESMSNMLNTYEQNQRQFFQNVSHELRTPLMSIQGYAEGILTDVLNKNEASEVILSESERMEHLVSQVLYVSRMDSGVDALDITSFGIKNLLYDCAGRIQILAGKRNIEIAFEFPQSDIELKTDESKLQRVIDNILSNGIRYAESKITIGYSACAEDIEISITDDGAGIEPTDLPHLFERFYKGKKGNSGLGLAISKDVIEKLGGNIRAENLTNGSGARFIITVPI